MKTRRLILALSGTALLAGALYVLLTSAGGSSAPVACAGLTGWGVPVLAGGVIGGVLWVLSGQPSKPMDDGPTASIGRSCPSCGSPVMDTWRLCPSCGSRVDERSGLG